MIKSRNRNVIIKSQFNINGSRGKDAGKFISDYVSRDSATDASTAYIPDPRTPPVQGDGVAFTLDQSFITRDETLNIADHVQELHQTGTRAIQQMVISFDHDYLVNQGVVDDDTTIVRKGDYRNEYDDVRLRYAVRSGLQSLIDREGYRDGKAVACIQWDTRHLHVHAVVYEDAQKIGRVRGKEEKGVIKASSFNQLTYDVERYLDYSKTPHKTPSAKKLLPTGLIADGTREKAPIVAVEPVYVNEFLRIIEERKRAAELNRVAQELVNDAKDIAKHIIDENGHVSQDVIGREKEQQAEEAKKRRDETRRRIEAMGGVITDKPL